MSLEGVQFDENPDLLPPPSAASANTSTSKILRGPVNFLVSHKYAASPKTAERVIAGAALVAMFISMGILFVTNQAPERTIPPHLQADETIR